LTLPRTGLVLLVGANNSGKSALLSALDLVVRGGTPTMPRHAGVSEPARVEATLVLSVDEQEQLLQASGLSATDRMVAFQWVEWHFVEAPPGVLQALELHASWPHRPNVLVAQVIPLSPSGYRVVINNGVLRILTGTSPYELPPDVDPLSDFQTLREGSGGGIPELVGNLPGWAPPLAPLVQFLATWRQSYYHFGALRQGTTWTHRLQSLVDLEPTGSNLPAVLLDLQHNRPTAWRRVRELIQRIVPDAGVLETRTGGEQMEVVFADPAVPGYRPNLKNLGTGVEQLLMTIVVGVTQPVPSIVVIEEPETNLHPGAQRALLAQLREWASDRLFVLSTHSPVFLDRASTTSTVFLVERAQGVSTVRQLTREPTEALSALGVQLSDVLSADHLLLIEGESDREILTVWFPELLSDPRVEVAIGHGGDNARFAGRINEWLQAVDRQHRRRVRYLRDRDELSGENLDRLERIREVHVLRRRELENYLLDPHAVAAAMVERQLPSPALIDADAVGRALREGADRLKPVVILKRIVGELASRRLVDRELVADLVQQGVTLERFRAAVAQRLPSEQLLDEIKQRWAAAEKDLEDNWEEHWQELAPGSEVLAGLWRADERTYDKLHDGLAIAKGMSAPAELTGVIRRFLPE
jgi:hypothetical protein